MDQPQDNQPSSGIRPGPSPRRPAPPAALDNARSLDRIQRVGRMAHKELREILRDRRTIITLIAMPLLLYPLMSVAFQQFYLASQITSAPELGFHVATLSKAELRALEQRIDQGKRAWRRARGLKSDGCEDPVKFQKLSRIIWVAWPSGREPLPHERNQDRQHFLEKLHEGTIDLLFEIPALAKVKDFPQAGDGPKDDAFLPAKAIYLQNSTGARAALDFLEMIFAAANEENLKQRLNVPNVSPRIALVSLRPEAIPVIEGEGSISLTALVPLILILMTITGAVYPAIDLTAGERERGTLEILVAAPVLRFDLLTAKYLAVVTVAVLNAIVNLVCMAVTLSWSGMGAVLIKDGNMSVFLFAEIFGLLLLFAAFFSAVLLCLTSFARSFKEAQAYLIPLMMVSLTPGVLAMLPGLRLQGILAVLPVMNVVLLARDLFDRGRDSSIDPVIAAIVIVTTLLYALAALSLAARVFGAESVLYSEQSGWSDLLRRSEAPRPVATIPAMLWCLALMLPVLFGLQAIMRELELSPASNIILNVVMNGILFALLPALFVFWERVDWRTGFGLGAPRPAAIAAGLLLGVSLWPLEMELLQRMHKDLPDSLKENIGAALLLVQQARESLGWGILAIGILPAIFEECFFRGLLFSALKTHCNALITIGVSAVLFALTHVVLGGALGLERMLPSLLLGLILSGVCWRTGSLWPCVIQHVCHNTILLTLGLNDPGSTLNIPWTWLAGGAAGTICAGLLLWLGGVSRSQKPLAA